MINKLKLQSIISKYYLNGTIESVKWSIKDNQLNIDFTGPNKDFIGSVNVNSFAAESCEVGIYNTTQLNKLIGITSGELMLSFIKTQGFYTKLVLDDTKFNLVYVLADTNLIPSVGAVTEPPKYDLEIDLNEDHIDSLIKAKNAIADNDHLVIKLAPSLDAEMGCDFTFGDNTEHSNRITYQIPVNEKKDMFELP